MVKRPLRFFAIIILILPLSACIFVMSVFPTTLSQVVARADLSAVIPANTGSQYQPFIVTPSGGEFVLLMRTNGGPDPVTIVMDSNLKVIQTYSLSQLNGWGYDGIGYRPMLNAEGTVEFSNIAFSTGDLSTVNHNASFGGHPSVIGPGFGSPTGTANDINFTTGTGNTLSYAQWSWFYAPFEFNSNPAVVNATGGNYRVVAVYDVDDTPAAGEVVLVLSDQGNSSNVYFVAIPLVDIVTPPGNVSSPLLSNYPYKTLSNVDAFSVGFAGDSLVAYSNDSNSFKRYSVTPPFNEIGNLSADKSKSQLQYAYKTTGGYYVVYDQSARTLTKVANWW